MSKKHGDDFAFSRGGFRAQKRWGQNFLINKGVVAKIIDAAQLKGNETVLEIGPGFGAMTESLLAAAAKVVAIEIDPRLSRHLTRRFRDHKNLQLVEGDALAFDFSELIPGEFTLVANLPYNITGPFMYRLTTLPLLPKTALLMVQWEVARRLTAQPGTKDYGALTIQIQYYFHAELLFRVNPGSFYPAPEVDSGVIRLERRPCPFPPKDPDLMFSLVKTAFSQRRKMFRGLLASALNIEKDTVTKAFATAGIDETVRGEDLSIEQFSVLADILGK